MSSIPPPSEFCRIGPVHAPRIWTGLWQLSSSAWGSADVEDIKQSLRKLVDSGYYFFGACLPYLDTQAFINLIYRYGEHKPE